MLNNNWFMREINKVRDTKLALTTEAAGALSNSGRCPSLDTFSSGSQKPRQISGRRGPLCSKLFCHEERTEEKRRKRKQERTTRGDQGSVSKAHSFIFNRGFYTLSCTQRIIEGVKSCKVKQSLILIETRVSFLQIYRIQMVQVIYIIFWPEGLLTFYDSDKDCQP